MFTYRHFIWLGICAVILTVILVQYRRNRPALKRVLTTALVVSIASELTKTFSVAVLVPSSGGAIMTPYVPLNHLPLHLCSIQIILIACARFMKSKKKRDYLLAFMYPTCLVGAFAALMLPSIFTTSISIEQAFTSPLSYQFFLFHTMLVALGVIIPMSHEVRWEKSHFTVTLAMLGLAFFVSIYINSMFAAPTYIDGELVSVDFMPNMFFSMQTPIGIEFTAIWQWYTYIIIMAAIAVALLYAFFYPLVFRRKRDK